MTKPLVYNYRKAEDEIALLKAEKDELQGQLIKMAIDLDYYKRKCEAYRDEIRKLNESRPGASETNHT